MPVAEYKSPGWNTHSECMLRELAFPLFAGSPEHFVVTRRYAGPADTYAAQPLDSLDSVFDGVAKSISGTAANDTLTFAADHNLVTGDPVTLAISGGLAGLAAGAYYFIRLTSTTGKLAATQALAAVGTAIDITSDGTGTLTPPVAYLVDQSPLRDADGSQVEYDRTFSTVPPSWSDSEEYLFTFPAYVVGTAFGTIYSVTAIAAGSGIFVLSTAATGIAAGDDVYVDIAYTRGGHLYHVFFRTKATAVSSGVSVTIGNLLPGIGAFSAIGGTGVRKGSLGRALSITLPCSTRLIHDYALCSEVALDTHLPLIDKFSPVLSTGFETDTLSTGAATVPNSATYSDMIKNEVELVAEASQRRRYLGNIWVRITRMAKAR